MRQEPIKAPVWTEEVWRAQLAALPETKEDGVEAILKEVEGWRRTVGRREATIEALIPARVVHFKEAMRELTGIREAAKTLDQFVARSVAQSPERGTEGV